MPALLGSAPLLSLSRAPCLERRKHRLACLLSRLNTPPKADALLKVCDGYDM